MIQELNNKIPAGLLQNTTTSYKFFWAISLLELIKLTELNVFELKYIIARMVADAVLVLNNNNIKLGGADHFRTSLNSLRKMYPYSFDSNNTLFNTLVKDINSNSIRKILGYYTENVPYRFLTPWVGTKILRSDLALNELMFELDAPYSIETRASDRVVSLNPSWVKEIKGREDVFISIIIDRLGSYIEHRNDYLPNSYLDAIKHLLHEQDAHRLPASVIEAMTFSESVARPAIYTPIEPDTIPIKNEYASNIARIKDIDESPMERGGTTTTVHMNKKIEDEIVDGKITSVRNPTILGAVLPLVETNKLEAISTLCACYENLEGLSMTFIDWGNLVEKMQREYKSKIITAPSSFALTTHPPKATALTQIMPRTNDDLPAFRLVKQMLSEGCTYNQILNKLEEYESAGRTDYRSKHGKPITKAIISHWAKELGYDVRPGVTAKKNLDNWKKTNEGYRWFKTQVLLGVSPDVIIEEYNKFHTSNPHLFSTPLGSGMTISTYNRWRREIISTNDGLDISKPLSPQIRPASSAIEDLSSSEGSALNEFYQHRGVYNVIEWAHNQPWWSAWKKNFKLVAEKTINEFLDDLKSPAYLIASAFPWGCTDEGRQYWTQVDDELKRHIKSDILAVLYAIKQQVVVDSQYLVKKERFSLLIGYDEEVFSEEIQLKELSEEQGLYLIEHSPDEYIFKLVDSN